MTNLCPCGSSKEYSQCCEQFIRGTKNPTTAEELMRSRYTAYALAEISYLKATLIPEQRPQFDPKSAKEWATESKWLGLQVLSVKNGQARDKTGVVEFIAKYSSQGKNLEHHEVSTFKKDSEGKWCFVDGDSHVHEEGHGHHANHVPVVREEPKVGRNDPCFCGSGKKYKKCCGHAA